MSEPTCIVDGCLGIYVPKVWAERYGQSAIESANVEKEDVDIVLAGPNAEHYWEAWICILDNYCHEVDGTKYYLHQDDDLFEYPEDFSWGD